MRVCIVSPHLDDAILSCGIAMQRLAAAGDEVVGLSVFTAGSGSALRRAEDRLAMSRIGTEPVHLDELDAPDRDPTYRSVRRLVGGALDPGDPYIDRVERRVCAFLGERGVDVAYFPLAAGSHIDHRIVHAVGRRIRGIAVRYYEDRPYVLWPGVLQGRMRQLGADAGLPEVTEQAMRGSVGDYHHLGLFLPEAEREALLPVYLAALGEAAPRVLAARATELVATEEELRRLYGCLALYASQIPAMHGDADRFVADSLRHERTRSGRSAYVERAWTLEALAP
jgi:LmbE family N-acetylglucosaminyl deacetylase